MKIVCPACKGSGRAKRPAGELFVSQAAGLCHRCSGLGEIAPPACVNTRNREAHQLDPEGAACLRCGRAAAYMTKPAPPDCGDYCG